MKEFRQHVVDRVLLSIFNKKALNFDEITEFDKTSNQPRLSKHAIQVLIGQITHQLEKEIAYDGQVFQM
jgi:CRISPR/Cas system-associated endonuclease Cas1